MLLTTTQAAESLGVTPRAIQAAIARGSLRATKPGRDWSISAAEVERYRRDISGRPGPKRKPFS